MDEHRDAQAKEVNEQPNSTRAAAPAQPSSADDAAALRHLLRESTERITALATASGQIIWATGPYGKGGDMPYWCAYTGQSAEEVQECGWLLALHPDDRERTIGAWDEAVAGSTPYQTVYRLRRADGVYRWFESRAVPLLGVDGGVREWVGCCVDVDERERLLESERTARERAEALAAQMEAVFTAMTDGVAIYDGQGRLLRINPAIRRVLGVRDEAGYVAQPLDERMTPFQMRGLAGVPLPPDQWVQRRIFGGEELTGERSVDIVFTALDGREVLVNLGGAPVRAVDGSITGGVVVARDVTATRLLERRTHKALAALLKMAEALVHVPLTELPDDGEHGVMRKQIRHLARLTHHVLPSEQVAMVTVDEATNRIQSLAVVGLPHEGQAQVEALLEAAPLEAYLTADELAALRSGEVLVIDLTASPRREVSLGATTSLLAPMRLGIRLVGMLVVNVGTGHNYTEDERELAAAVAKLAALVVERERLQREGAEARASELALREANQHMDEFLGIAGHELRTPLTTIKAGVQMSSHLLDRLRRDESDVTERQAQTLARIAALLARSERQIARQNRLVSDLLDVSRIQADTLDLRPRRCDLVKLAREVVAGQRLAHPRREITLDLPKGSHHLTIEADADRIAQVVTNYLTNALKYAPTGPIVVRVERRDTTAWVSVTDKGPGLAPGERERVWERFYRAPDASGDPPMGMGIGLFLCKSLVERQGGHVGVESAPGEGSTFWLELPLAQGR